jgi:hypothetical protein
MVKDHQVLEDEKSEEMSKEITWKLRKEMKGIHFPLHAELKMCGLISRKENGFFFLAFLEL